MSLPYTARFVGGPTHGETVDTVKAPAEWVRYAPGCKALYRMTRRYNAARVLVYSLATLKQVKP